MNAAVIVEDQQGEVPEKSVENQGGSSSDDDFEDKYAYRCLKKLDRDFQSSPRLIVRGIWRGDVLELQAKRRTEGTWVQWVIKDMKKKKTVLRIRANMIYKYGLGLSHVTDQYGYNKLQYKEMPAF